MVTSFASLIPSIPVTIAPPAAANDQLAQAINSTISQEITLSQDGNLVLGGHPIEFVTASSSTVSTTPQVYAPLLSPPPLSTMTARTPPTSKTPNSSASGPMDTDQDPADLGKKTPQEVNVIVVIPADLYPKLRSLTLLDPSTAPGEYIFPGHPSDPQAGPSGNTDDQTPRHPTDSEKASIVSRQILDEENVRARVAAQGTITDRERFDESKPAPKRRGVETGVYNEAETPVVTAKVSRPDRTSLRKVTAEDLRPPHCSS